VKVKLSGEKLMSKSQSLLVFILLVVLLAFVGFLAWQLTAFHSEYNHFISQNQGHFLDSKKIDTEISDLKQKLKEQDETIQDFASQLSALPASLKAELRREFIPHPEYTSAKPLYTAEKVNDANIKVTGNSPALKDWQKRNELFFDYVLQQSLAVDFDPTQQRFVVTDIIPDSVFWQMGLKKGDVIAGLNAKPIANSDDFKFSLMEMQPAKLDVLRDNKKIVFDIAYAEINPNQVSLDITQNEFKAVVPDLLKTASIAPSMKEGKVDGVKIVSVDPVNPLSLMGIQSEDVIKSVADAVVTPETFVETLKASSAPLNLKFTRAGEEKNIFVSFAE
jgi:S1-C subfamily serine protease